MCKRNKLGSFPPNRLLQRRIVPANVTMKLHIETLAASPPMDKTIGIASVVAVLFLTWSIASGQTEGHVALPKGGSPAALTVSEDGNYRFAQNSAAPPSQVPNPYADDNPQGGINTIINSELGSIDECYRGDAPLFQRRHHRQHS